jgi:predicted kinase
MKKLYMLIGIPGSGKSTWVKNQDWLKDAFYISSDNHLDKFATSVGKTHDEVYKEYIKTAEKLVKEDVVTAISAGKDVVWDQTNTSLKTRKKKLYLFADYYKIAVYFKVPDDEELKKRLKSRPGKHISQRVIHRMKSSLVVPTEQEGFDEIWYS